MGDILDRQHMHLLIHILFASIVHVNYKAMRITKTQAKLTFMFLLYLTICKTQFMMSGVNLKRKETKMNTNHDGLIYKSKWKSWYYLSEYFRCRVTREQKMSKLLFPVLKLSSLSFTVLPSSKLKESRIIIRSWQNEDKWGARADGICDLTCKTDQDYKRNAKEK